MTPRIDRADIDAPGSRGRPRLPVGRRLLFAAPFALALALVAFVALASADSRIGAEGSAAGELQSPRGVAVSEAEGGDVYVADAANQRVDQFQPDGAFLRAFGFGVRDGAAELQTCTALTGCRAGTEGTAPGQLRWSDAVAVDNSCAEQEPPLTGVACETFDPSYGDLYVVDQRNYRVEKYALDPINHEYEFLLMFGGGVDQGPHHPGDLCTAAYLAEGDACGAGLPGTGPSHFFKAAECTNNECTGAWGGLSNNSIAIGPDGTVYVGDYGRIQEFEPGGTFRGELALGESEPLFVSSLALDRAGDLFERSATYNGGSSSLFKQVSGVREFGPGPTHSFLRTFDAGPEEAGSEPTHIAVDATGNLIVTDFNGGDFQFRAFKPDGNLFAIFTSPQVKTTFVGNPAGLAAGATALFATAQEPEGAHVAAIPLSVIATGPPTVGEESAGDVEATTATLEGVVNPKGFDTHYHVESITDRQCAENEAASHECFQGAAETPLPPGADLGLIIGQDPVRQAISGLSPDTLYDYRIVASNAEGTAPGAKQTFRTLPPISIRGLATQLVAPEETTIKAEVNPDGSLAATHYTICYGAQAGSYTLGCSAGSLGAGNSFAPIEAAFTGLEPDTTYHYRLIVENENTVAGPVESPDQELTTEPSAAEERAAEDCPANGTVHGEVRSTLREQNSSLALPDCRAYEQVSPVDKAGYGVSSFGPTNFGISPAGENAAFASTGAFAGAVWSHSLVRYFSRRTPAGWETEAALRRPVPDSEPSGPSGADPELDKWVFALQEGVGNFGVAVGGADRGGNWFGLAGGATVEAGPSLEDPAGRQISNVNYEPFAASPDLSTLLIRTGTQLLPSPEDPRPTTGGRGSSRESRIYELSGAGGPSPHLRLLAEIPSSFGEPDSQGGTPEGSGCDLDPDGAFEQGGNVVSADGSTVFYVAPLAIETGPGADCGEGTPNPYALFARIGAAPALLLSAESPTQCSSGHPCAGAAPESARFFGASPAGSAAWFTTAQPLIDADTDATEDLYLARLEAGAPKELVQASAGEATAHHPTPGAGAEVQGVLGVSQDGSHAYFVARGELTSTPDPTTGQAAAPGADNLYAYDAEGGALHFIARLCSGPEESGSLPDPACGGNLVKVGHGSVLNDGGLWESPAFKQAELTPDGRYLLFSSFARLTPDDTDDALDVYRFDFATGRLTRVSSARDGNDAGGNDDAFPAEIVPWLAQGPGFAQPNQLAGDNSRSISGDGSLVIFRTAAPLTSRDTDLGADPGCGGAPGESGCDVYQWEEDGRGSCDEAGGCVRLLSDGLDPHGTSVAAIGSSGRDVAFITDRGLAPADTDGIGDVYDAREGGGFPFVPPGEPCGGAETCHGEGTGPGLSPSYTSQETHSGGNGPQKLLCAKGRRKVKRHGQVRCVAGRHKKHHKKSSHHHKKHTKASKRAAKTNRGGAK